MIIFLLFLILIFIYGIIFGIIIQRSNTIIDYKKLEEVKKQKEKEELIALARKIKRRNR